MARRNLPALAPALLLLAMVAVTLVFAPMASTQTPVTEVHLQPGGNIATAISQVSAGGDVYLEQGTYPFFRTTTRNAGAVTVHAEGAVIQGFDMRGSANLTLRGGRITAGMQIQSGGSNVTTGPVNPATNVTVDGIDTKARLQIMNAPKSVSVINSYFHDGSQAINGPGGKPNATFAGGPVTIAHNTFERLSCDAVETGFWNDVTFAQNMVRDVKPLPGGCHSDGFQVTGQVDGLRVAHNDFVNVQQAVFIQANQPVNDVQIEDNNVSGFTSVAMQLEGATNSSVIGNAICNPIWSAGTRGLDLRRAPSTTAPPVVYDTVRLNTISAGYVKREGASVTNEDTNLSGTEVC